MSVTSVRISPELQEGLEQVSDRLHRSKNWLINQALREFLERADSGALRWQETLAALDSVAEGRVVDGDAVQDWLESWGSSEERPPPAVRR